MPGGGTVEITVRGDEEAVEVTVADEGIGIPEDIQSRIFDRDFTTKKGGSGIGLAVVQQVIKLHGGRIRLRSKPGDGTAVTIVLPARRTEPVTVG